MSSSTSFSFSNTPSGPSASTTVFDAFRCEGVEMGAGEATKKRWLRADYAVACDGDAVRVVTE